MPDTRVILPFHPAVRRRVVPLILRPPPAHWTTVASFLFVNRLPLLATWLFAFVYKLLLYYSTYTRILSFHFVYPVLFSSIRLPTHPPTYLPTYWIRHSVLCGHVASRRRVPSVRPSVRYDPFSSSLFMSRTSNKKNIRFTYFLVETTSVFCLFVILTTPRVPSLRIAVHNTRQQRHSLSPGPRPGPTIFQIKLNLYFFNFFFFF